MTTVEHNGFASPLSLLGQWRGRPDGVPLRELVVLGYTVDLPFLERFCVPDARQMGARVTVVTDADHAVHDPVDVRFAGAGYLYGAASIPGAFHPKLAVLLGDEDVWAAIGSGNPTMAGWGHNHELWCVLRGRVDTGLRAQADLGAWLRDLPASVPMAEWIGQVLADVGARMVPDVVDDTCPEVRLVHNLRAPIVDQLPDAARELRLAAPFVDRAGAALRALVRRSRPERVGLALQRDLGSFDGRTLTAALAGTVAEFREVDDRRTVHGKLLEHHGHDGVMVATVGSPNLTAAALLRTVSDGGHCELGITAPVDRSLFPDAPVVAAEDVAQWRPTAESDRDDPPLSLRLLGVRQTGAGLDLEILSSRSVAVTVETSVTGAPGSWQVRGVLPAPAVAAESLTRAALSVPEAAGAAVRLVADVDGGTVWSAPAFVADPVRCRPRTDVGDAPALRGAYDLEDVITDEALLRRFGSDLVRLLDLAARHRATAAPVRAPGAVHPADDRARRDGWSEFLDVVAHAVGADFAALAFPGALPSPATPDGTSGWAVGVVEDETELAEDETEDVIERLEPTATRTARAVAPHARAAYRSWIRKWVRALRPATTPAPPLPLRMTVAALFLELLAAGVWGSDEQWRELLGDVVRSLVGDTDEIDAAPPESGGYLASLVAVCLAVLCHDVTIGGGRHADIVATRAWEPAHWIVTLAEEPVVAALVLRSEQSYARLADHDEVLAVIALAAAAAADPHAEVLSALAASGIDVEREHGARVGRGTFRNPMRAAARMATELFDGAPLTCVATAGERSVIIARDATTVAVLDSAVGRWRRYPLHRPRTPQTLLDEGVPPTRDTHPSRPVPATVLALAGDADLEALLDVYGPSGRRF